MKVISHNDGTYTARLKNGYEGTANRNPQHAKTQAVHEFNKDLRMVNQRASDFGVRIRYEMPSQAELDARFPSWTPGS